MSGKTKPISIRGNNTWLNIWVGEQYTTIKVSRKGEKGFETIDTYRIPTEFLVYKLLESGASSVLRACEIAEKLVEVEGEPETESNQ